VNILQALKKEETKFLKQLDSARQQLETVRAAMKVLGGNTTGKKKRFVSKASRARMAKAQKERWKKIRAEKKSGSK
jgi:hypothetical protein